MTADPIILADAARDPATVGGKAAALSRLSAAGFRVPDFFVITPGALAGDAGGDGHHDAILAAVEALGPGPFAVRSSAREEDGADHSHAGQFLSVLDVAAGDVTVAAGRILASGRANSVAAYRRNRGLTADGGPPAVIVQRLVAARAAGVAFTADPVGGRRDRIVVSATAGLGDKLVGGAVDGDDYVIDRAGGAVIARPDGPAALTDTDLAQLFALAKGVEAACGAPQDLEWAFEGETLFLLQSRPITTPLRPMPNPDAAVIILDNSNIVESYPGLVSPLTFSFAQYVYARVYRIFVALVGVDADTIRQHAAVFDNMLSRFDGRIYYNLINWYRTLCLLPGFRNNRGFMETMMGVGEPLRREIADTLAPPPARGLARLGERRRVGWMLLRLCLAALRLRATIAAFERRLDAALRTDRSALRDLPLSALAAEYRRIEAELLERWDAPLINDFLCMVAFGASRKALERWAGDAGVELHNAMMIGQGDIVSAEPPRRIAAMARLIAGDAALIAALESGDRAAATAHPALDAALDDYIARFGDRCIEELKLESITLDDDPRPLLSSVAAAARRPPPPDRADAVTPDRQLRLLFKGRPLTRLLAGALLRWAKARVRDRENLRFERTRVFGHARQVFLAIGRQFAALGAIERDRDIFDLTLQEVLGAIEGNGVSADLAGLVALRRAEAARDVAAPEPPERIELRGAAIARGHRAATGPAATAERQRRGTGCSAGRITARATVVHDPRGQRLAEGDILVARHTDPGWIALFAGAAGLVVERGSLLSHSAIVAREMGIPCVVGLKGATTWLRTGDLVEVDGAAGSVRIIGDG